MELWKLERPAQVLKEVHDFATGEENHYGHEQKRIIRACRTPDYGAQIACPFKFHQIDGSYWKWGQAPFFPLDVIRDRIDSPL